MNEEVERSEDEKFNAEEMKKLLKREYLGLASKEQEGCLMIKRFAKRE